jgi:hypothetical protein
VNERSADTVGSASDGDNLILKKIGHRK